MVITTVLACQKKAVPVISDRKAPLPKRTTFIYPPVADVAVDTAKGRILFNRSCDRCHGLPEAQLFTKEKWDEILPDMFPRAGFSNEQALHVRGFILANVK